MAARKPYLIIGQAKGVTWQDGPPSKSKLWRWFETIGWTQERALKKFQFDAMIGTGTAKAKKGRVPPKPEQIAAYKPELIATIDRLKPKLIITVGGLAAKHVLNTNAELVDLVGQSFEMKPLGVCKNKTTIIPLPHHSGVSLWLNAASHRALWADAMQLIKQQID